MTALALSVWLATQPAAAPKQPMLGEPAPAFRLKDLKGETLSLEALRGRVVVLHFGASW